MTTDRRLDFRPVVPDAGVFFAPVPCTAQAREYLSGIAHDLSLGGMFIRTRRPLAAGTVIKLLLFSAGDPPSAPPVHARALVQWRNLWREPRGMGVQFIDFTGVGRRDLETWLDALLSPAAAEVAAAVPRRLPPLPALGLSSAR